VRSIGSGTKNSSRPEVRVVGAQFWPWVILALATQLDLASPASASRFSIATL
jgi:hypothetical protein